MSEPVSAYADTQAEVWCGDCLDPSHVATVMGGRVADALIFDAPYSEKTHAGHKNGKLTADRAAGFARAMSDRDSATAESRYSARQSAAGKSGRRDIDYLAFDAAKIAAFCALWLPLCTGWIVSLTDDVLAPAWGAELSAAGLYVFAPLPLVETGSRVRMTGDGPSNWACWVVVARPTGARYSKWGALPGAYVQAAERDINSQEGSDRIVGGKPLRSMCALVRDYSRRGDLVVDPFAGGATTLMAAKQLGRLAIGIELDKGRAALGAKRIAKTHEQTDLFEKVESA